MSNNFRLARRYWRRTLGGWIFRIEAISSISVSYTHLDVYKRQGLGLTLGCLYRLSSVGGMILLAMYTLSHPSFVGASYMMPFEGSYLWIDKNLVEFAALGLMCVFPTSQIIGFDRVLGRVCPILHKLKFI